MEVTNCLKPSESVSRIGDSASVRPNPNDAARASHEAMGVKRIVSERQWQILQYLFVRYPRF